MDTRQADHDLVPTTPARLRWLLLAVLVAIGAGYVVAFVFFVRNSEDFVGRQIEAAAARYACDHPLRPPAVVRLVEGSPDLARLGTGWNGPEADGIWTRDPEASLAICLPQGHDFTIDIELRSFVARRHPDVAVVLAANGTALASWHTRPGQDRIVEQIRLPGEVIGDGRVRLTLNVESPASPLRMHAGPDPRWLGVFVSRLAISPAAPR